MRCAGSRALDIPKPRNRVAVSARWLGLLATECTEGQIGLPDHLQEQTAGGSARCNVAAPAVVAGARTHRRHGEHRLPPAGPLLRARRRCRSGPVPARTVPNRAAQKQQSEVQWAAQQQQPLQQPAVHLQRFPRHARCTAPAWMAARRTRALLSRTARGNSIEVWPCTRVQVQFTTVHIVACTLVYIVACTIVGILVLRDRRTEPLL